MWSFKDVRDNLAHMLAQDPMGINSPLEYSEPKAEKLDLRNPVNNIYCNWNSNKVEMYHTGKDLKFSVKYENRTAGEVAAEVTKIINYLS